MQSLYMVNMWLNFKLLTCFSGLGTSPIVFFGSKQDHPKANMPDAYNLNMYSCIIYIYIYI